MNEFESSNSHSKINGMLMNQIQKKISGLSAKKQVSLQENCVRESPVRGPHLCGVVFFNAIGKRRYSNI